MDYAKIKIRDFYIWGHSAFAFVIFCFCMISFSSSKWPEVIALTIILLAAFVLRVDFPRQKNSIVFTEPLYVLAVLALGCFSIFPLVISSLLFAIYVLFDIHKTTGKWDFGYYRMLIFVGYSLRMVPGLALAAWIYQKTGGFGFTEFSQFRFLPFSCMASAVALYDEITLYSFIGVTLGKFSGNLTLGLTELVEFSFIPTAIPVYLAYRHFGVYVLFLFPLPIIGILLLLKFFLQERKRRAETADLLNVANGLISATLDFEGMLGKITQRVYGIFGADSVSLYLHNQSDWKLASKIGNNTPIKPEVIAEACHRDPQSPFVVRDLKVDSRFSEFKSSTFNSMLVIPLLSGQDLSGFVLCQHHVDHYFIEDYVDLAKILVGQLSSGLESAKLHKQLASALKELQETQAQLVQSEKMAGLGKLVAGVAHELNNPLNFISMQLPLIKNRVEELEELAETYKAYEPSLPNEDRDLLTDLRKSFGVEEMPVFFAKAFSALAEGTTRCKRIIENLRTFARTETVGESWDFVDINEAIDSTLLLLTDRHENRITLHKEYGNLPKVWCNAPQMNQVFMNLLANAFDAIPGEGEVWIKTEINDGKCMISIRDSGQGIPDEIKAKIFDPFFTTKEVGKGTGLGLSIVYTIIQQHKAEIQVDSAVGKGTIFTVTLPLKEEGTAIKRF